MNLSWDYLTEDKESLKEALNDYGTRGIASHNQIGKSTVNRYAKKIGLDYKNNEWIISGQANSKSNTNTKQEEIKDTPKQKTAAEDKNIKVIEYEEFYGISKNGKNTIIPKPLLDKVYKYYCLYGFTQDESADKAEISYDKFKLIKDAFHLVHDSVPQPEYKFKENSIEDLVNDTWSSEKQKFREEYEIKKQREMEKEYKQLSKDKFFTEFAIEKTLPHIKALDTTPVKFNINFNDTEPPKIAVIGQSDTHVGKFIDGRKLIGKPRGYNKDIFKWSMKYFAKEAIKIINRYENIQKIIIPHFGDVCDDPDAQVYDGQVYNQDVYGVEQMLLALEQEVKFLVTIRDYLPNIEFHQLIGNHSKNPKTNWDEVFGYWLRDRISKYDDIDINIHDEEDAVIPVGNAEIVATHYITRSRSQNRKEKDSYSLLRMIENNNPNTYLIQAHEHHREMKEITNAEYRILGSMCGADGLAQQKMRVSSRPTQSVFIFDEEKLIGDYPIYLD